MLESAQNKLYDPRLEHDACGIGAVVSLRGIKTHQTVDNALKIVEKLEHRAGKDASGETGGNTEPPAWLNPSGSEQAA